MFMVICILLSKPVELKTVTGNRVISSKLTESKTIDITLCARFVLVVSNHVQNSRFAQMDL